MRAAGLLHASLLALLLVPAAAAPVRAEEAPFFPLGLYSVDTPHMRRAARLGFNLVVGGADTSFMRAAARHGLRVVANTFFEGSDTDRRTIRALRGERNLVAHVLVDEPDIYGKPPERVAEWRRGLLSLDTRPAFGTTWSPRNYAVFKRYADIFCPTPYPIVSTAPVDDLSAVFLSVIAARAAEPRGIPVWCAVQCFAGLPTWPRPPTPAELRSMAYQAVIAGAEGILYYAMSSNEPYPMPSGHPRWWLFEDTGLVRALRDLNREFAGLAVPLLRGARPYGAAADGPVVHTLIRRGDRAVLLAANTSSRPHAHREALPPDLDPGRRRVIASGGATVTADSSGILVRCGPFATAAVEIPVRRR